MTCQSCQESSTTPLNFLLNCISCADSWHHRCHSPPVSDKELIDIIKVYNAQKHNNPTANLTWQCGICVKVKNAINHQNRPLTAFKKVTPRHVATSQKAIVIDTHDDDDDDIIALDGPSEVPKRNETTKSEVGHLFYAVTSSHPKHQSSATAAASDQLNTPRILPQPGSTKEFLIIDDPFLVSDPSPRAFKPSQTSSRSSKPQGISQFIDLTNSDDEGGGSDVLEYLTPPPTPAPTSRHVMEEVPLIVTLDHPLPRDTFPPSQISNMTTTTQPPNQLLTRWLDDRITAVGVRPDLWTRTCLRRDQDTANRKGLKGVQSVQPAPSIPPPPRRKCKAHKLNERSLTPSQATIFLSAEGWLREKQAALLLE